MADGNQRPRQRIESAMGRVDVDLALGNLWGLAFDVGGRTLRPLHTAPWVDEPEVQRDVSLLPVERALSGDFFCAPFGASDVEEAPAHGWPANSAWDVVESGQGTARLRLRKPVMGATITKSLSLSGDAPLLYQIHWIEGGSGGLTVAHHPMVHLSDRGRFFCSPKRAVLTPDHALEEDRNRLALAQRVESISEVPGAQGGAVDLTELPIGDAHEDFVTLVEAPGNSLGWSAVLREAEGDIVFVLKDPRVLPVTMLWHSNGGRDYAPWNGRHRGVLGIEDGCAAGAAGHAAALQPNAISAEGVATALPLRAGRTHRVAHVIGAIPIPAGWTQVSDISVEADTLTLTGDGAATQVLPFDAGFFAETS